MTGKLLTTIVVFAVAIVANPLHFVFAAGECDDAPEVCEGPRSWLETFDEDPLVVSPDDWQQRNGTQAMPEYDGGKAIFDGFVAPWMLIDTADHFFQGETRIHIAMDANPVDGPDLGAGWWVNADNNAQKGGFYAIYGVLARNDDGEQEYTFGPAWAQVEEVVPVAEGGVDVSVTLLPNEDEEVLIVTYSITDAVETHTGEFEVFGANGGNQLSADKWFTLFANDSGSGVIDFVEVVNQPIELLGDYNSNGELDAGDLNLQAQAILDQDLAFDLNGDNAVDYGDRVVWVRDLKATWIGDSDLDGEFYTGDLVIALGAGTYENDITAGWVEGDWSGDMRFESGDLVAGLADGGYEQGPRAAISAVPEFSGPLLLALGTLGLSHFRRNKR